MPRKKPSGEEQYRGSVPAAENPDAVRLKPILGVKPGVYLAVIYAFVILAVLFLVLWYPGLSKPGGIVVFRSEPAGAAVRVDGLTRGATPCEVYLARGSREIELVLPGFTPYRTTWNMGARVFGSLFFPLRETLTETLEAASPLAPLLLGAEDYARWALAGEPGAAYQIPQSLSEGAYRGGAAAKDPVQKAAMDSLLREALGFAVTRAALRDLVRARFLTDNGGLAASPLSLGASLADMAALLARTPGSAAWLADLVSGETAAFLEKSPWYARDAGAAVTPLPTAPPAGASGPDLELGGLVFREIPGGVLDIQGPLPRRGEIPGFRIALTEVSPGAWELFTAANPGWGRENREALGARGQAGPDYLSPPLFPEAEAGVSGVSAVSWYAAEAYCRWLSGLLPPALADFEVRLPTEAEWEYAARAAALPEAMTGGHWEWCADPFSPLLLYLPGETQTLPSPERSLRGGSWINAPETAGIETRASLPPETCSPFVSFRPLIAPRSRP
jgi:hypothetical protein